MNISNGLVNYNLSGNKEETKGKNIKSAVCSFLLPGSGQLVQGRTKDAFVQATTAVGLGVATHAVSKKAVSMLEIFREMKYTSFVVSPFGNMKNPKLTFAALAAGNLVLGGLVLAQKIASCLDAKHYVNEEKGGK